MKPSLVCSCAALLITLSRAGLADDLVVLEDPDEQATTPVHVTGNRPGVTLERTIDGEWQTLCNVPCDGRVPYGQYRLGGTGLRPSNVVELFPGGPTTLRGSLAPEGRVRTGAVLTIIGGTLLVIAGAFFTAAGLAAAGQDEIGKDLSLGFFGTLGVVHAAPGLGLLVPGAILWASGSSKVEVGEPRQAGFHFTMDGAKLLF